MFGYDPFISTNVLTAKNIRLDSSDNYIVRDPNSLGYSETALDLFATNLVNGSTNTYTSTSTLTIPFTGMYFVQYSIQIQNIDQSQSMNGNMNIIDAYIKKSNGTIYLESRTSTDMGIIVANGMRQYSGTILREFQIGDNLQLVATFLNNSTTAELQVTQSRLRFVRLG